MTITTLESYVSGRWVAGKGNPTPLVNPATEEQLAESSTEGLDFKAAREHAVERGGPALRELSFAQRGELLKSLSKTIHAHRDELIELGVKNAGNTRGDAKFDVDGASGTLASYAELGASLGEAKYFTDGDPISLGRSSRMAGQHVLVPRHGVAYHVNAYNFPAWGIAEKAATAILAGVPVITKPATPTALMAFRLMQLFVESKALPEGALQFVAGDPHDLLEHLGPQDVLAFTGSHTTGAKLRAKSSVVEHGVRVNVEADSLNAAVLGADVSRGDDAYQLFLADVARDVTQKAGQKCTAIRRVFVPADKLEEVQEDLLERVAQAKLGAPDADGVTMGPLATAAQLQTVIAGIERLRASGADVVTGGAARVDGLGAPAGKGYFVAPTVLVAKDAAGARDVHEHEVFGPVTTLLPYTDLAQVLPLIARAGGGLVSTIYTDDRAAAAQFALGLAPFHGRVCVASSKVQGAWLGPGTVLPQLLHGGPGRAGGGEELGGTRGMGLYLQRTALQGYGPLIEQIVAGARRFA